MRDALVAALRRAADYVKYDQAPPACVLWTDEKRQWEPLVPRLRAVMSELLTLGVYAPEMRTGPAIWLRCMIACTLPDIGYWPDDATPVLYLPGIGKQDLKAVETAPHMLQPLAELQYRGTIWNQPQGQRDWTILSFLTNGEGGLGVEVLRDGPTQAMLPLALLALAELPVARLHAAAPLRAAWLRDLLLPDSARTLLQWLSDPVATRAALTDAGWSAFVTICQEQYHFDPARDGPLTAAALLAKRNDAWAAVWERFAESPAAYPGVPKSLRRASRPLSGTLSDASGAWPQENDEAETTLRAALAGLRPEMPGEARDAVLALEVEHAPRREWVWAQLGQSPLALALSALASLAQATAAPLAGGDIAGIVAAYAGGGWEADAAALDALAAVTSGDDVAVVKNAVHILSHVWLRDAAEAFATAVGESPSHYASPPRVVTPPELGVCLLFADGLRYDVGQRLVAHLDTRGYAASAVPHLAALPTVTPTAKPALSPVAGWLGPGTGFDLAVTVTGQKVNVEILRGLLANAGYTVLRGDDIGTGSGAAWTESGSLDSYGHGQGWKLARRVREEIRELADRIAALLDAGWQEVRVVTDHGWLLLPGGLPKADPPVAITDEKKGRCARLKPGAAYEGQTVPWHWDADVRVAVAPGISCFEAGKEYEHGGLSPQECVVPVITVRATTAATAPVTIESVEWHRLRVRVRLAGALAGCSVDIRTKPGDAATSRIKDVKGMQSDGVVSLFVADPDDEGSAAHVVVLDMQGSVLAQRLTTIGGE